MSTIIVSNLFIFYKYFLLSYLGLYFKNVVTGKQLYFTKIISVKFSRTFLVDILQVHFSSFHLFMVLSFRWFMESFYLFFVLFIYIVGLQAGSGLEIFTERARSLIRIRSRYTFFFLQIILYAQDVLSLLKVEGTSYSISWTLDQTWWTFCILFVIMLV